MQKIWIFLSNEIIFWVSWIIIPLLVEIVPAIAGFLILVKKKILYRKDSALVYEPQITLIIPVYNSAQTLYACLDSVRLSDYPVSQIEILLVNNKSTDDSFRVYTDYQKEHPEINMKWMNSEQGKSRALNMALFHAEGKYIIHIDSDGVLHRDALRNMITRFEAHGNIHCMTGSILTSPEMIRKEKNPFRRMLQKTEFFEYAQAFLAGRNFEAELNSIFTMSGAFSAFRKSTILKTQLYNTDTVCEDTQVTFQIRRLLGQKIAICEQAVFFVDPIESVQKLCLQRQRWQRGELEVAHMFMDRGNVVKNIFTNFMTRVILFDHTFAFPRMIWYFALLCLAFMNYPFSFIVISVVLIYVLYVLSGLLYYFCIISYLAFDKKLCFFYARNILYLLVLPLYNFMVYWFRMEGIINSIRTPGSWRTKTFREERKIAGSIVRKDFFWLTNAFTKIKKWIYKDEKTDENSTKNLESTERSV